MRNKLLIIFLGMFILLGALVPMVSAAPEGVSPVDGTGGKKMWNFNNHTVTLLSVPQNTECWGNVSDDLSPLAYPETFLVEKFTKGNVGGDIYGDGSGLSGVSNWKGRICLIMEQSFLLGIEVENEN
jgi:hypothetical protein